MQRSGARPRARADVSAASHAREAALTRAPPSAPRNPPRGAASGAAAAPARSEHVLPLRSQTSPALPHPCLLPLLDALYLGTHGDTHGHDIQLTHHAIAVR